MEWNLKENPPIDNRDILIYCPNSSQKFYIGHYDIGEYIIHIENDKEVILKGVTHWAELPDSLAFPKIHRKKYPFE